MEVTRRTTLCQPHFFNTTVEKKLEKKGRSYMENIIMSPSELYNMTEEKEEETREEFFEKNIIFFLLLNKDFLWRT